jgi:hypothetical protein
MYYTKAKYRPHRVFERKYNQLAEGFVNKLTVQEILGPRITYPFINTITLTGFRWPTTLLPNMVDIVYKTFACL